MGTEEKKGYLYGIDVLKAIAITGVVLFHVFPDTVKGGFLGVCLFFVISGFLLVKQSNSAWRKQNFHMETFYAKRLPKLYSGMYAMVVTTLAFMTMFAPKYLAGRFEELKSIFLGYNNWWQIGQQASYFTRITNQSPFTHLWYMGIMIQVIVAWPVCVFLYQKIKREFSQASALFAILLVTVGSMVCMGYFYHTTGVTRAYYGTESRLFSLCVGVLCGLYDCKTKKRWKIGRRSGNLLLISGMILTGVLYFYVEGTMKFLYYGGMAALSAFFGVLVLFVSKSTAKNAGWMRFFLFRWIGRHSYFIYLWHYPIIFFFQMWR